MNISSSSSKLTKQLMTVYLAIPTQKVPMLSEGAGSVTWNVLERTGTPAITGPEVM